ncbi:MAG TPA: transcriptional regulator [Steroidobacteraceae bacterium]
MASTNRSAVNRSPPARREELPARAALKLTTAVSRASEEAKFDRLVYERVRLGIMSALAVNEQLTFNELKGLFDVSDGNLSAHARKLEEAGYIACAKSFAGRRPKSEYRLTSVGRRALYRYLEHIEAVIQATRR